jgi:hypothetical protein
MIKEEIEFNAAIAKYTEGEYNKGWSQFYFIVAEITSNICRGKWFYIGKFEGFWEIELIDDNRVVLLVKKCDENKLYDAVRNGYVMLYRRPRRLDYEKIYPYKLIY